MSSSTATVTGAAGRYASAIFDLARENGAIESVETDLRSLGTLIGENDELSRVVGSPAFSREQQKGAMAALMQKMGASDLATKFVGLMVQKGRLHALPSAIEGFKTLAAAHRGEETAKVVSAQPMSEGQQAALAQTLKDTYGKDVRIEAETDPSLLGGIIVQVGSRMVDASLKSKIERLERAMKDN